MRFRAEQHLRRQREIRAVREQGRRVDCRAFTLWWRRRDRPAEVNPADVAAPALATAAGPAKADGARVCVIASTAAVGGAIRRNRAKRRLRELFRHHQAEVPSDCDLLLIARAAATEWPVADLEKRFAEACRQIPPAATSVKASP